MFLFYVIVNIFHFSLYTLKYINLVPSVMFFFFRIRFSPRKLLKCRLCGNINVTLRMPYGAHNVCVQQIKTYVVHNMHYADKCIMQIYNMHYADKYQHTHLKHNILQNTRMKKNFNNLGFPPCFFFYKQSGPNSRTVKKENSRVSGSSNKYVPYG